MGGKLTLEHTQSRVARLLFVVTAFGAIALTAAHIFVGGRFFVGGIFASNDLDPVVQWMAYFVWHVVSVFLMLIAAAFTYLAWRFDSVVVHVNPLAYFATALLLGVGVLGISFGLISNGTLSVTCPLRLGGAWPIGALG